MSRKQGAWSSAALVATLLLGGVYTVSAEDVYELKPVIITATRTEKTLLDVPANAQIITGKELKESGNSSVFEAVMKATNANSHTYTEDGLPYGGMDSRIRLRGIDNGTLVMINGMPTNFKNASTVNNVPMEQIERIEVVKGSNSVLYGPQAMGGVINIITKKPTAGAVNGTVFAGYGNYYREAGVNVNTKTLNVGYKAYGRGDIKEMQLPGNTGKGSAMNQLDGEGSQFYGTLKITDELTASYGHTNGSVIYETSKFKDGKWDQKQIKRGKTDITWANWDILYDSKANGWRIGAGYHSMDLNVIYDNTAPKKSADKFYNGYNLTFDAQKRIHFHQGQDSLILGANYNKEDLDYGKQNNTLESYAFYQSWDHAFTDRFNMIFGVREYFMNKSKYLDDSTEILPQVQGLYKLNENSSLYFNVGKSFEMPSVGQFFYYGKKSVINSDLKPQSSWSYEIGYKQENEKGAFTADLFYMDVKDKFYWSEIEIDGTKYNIMRNHDQWRNKGIELSYMQHLNKHQDVSFGLTWQKPEAQDANNGWQQDTAKVILNAGTIYHKDKFTFDARLFSYMKRELAYYGEDKVTTTGDHTLPNTLDLTVSLTYKPTELDTIRLVGRNLLDRDNIVNKYEYLATPANYVLSYEHRF